MFTERFISVPIELIKIKERDIIGGNCPRTPATAKINAFEITYFNESMGNLLLPITMIEFEEILNNNLNRQ